MLLKRVLQYLQPVLHRLEVAFFSLADQLVGHPGTQNVHRVDRQHGCLAFGRVAAFQCKSGFVVFQPAVEPEALARFAELVAEGLQGRTVNNRLAILFALTFS